MVANGHDMATLKIFGLTMLIPTRVGEKRLVLAHLPEHDVIVAFERVVDGREIEVTSVDYHGLTAEHGRLDRAFVYMGPMWAVWLHFFPGTDLVK